LTQWCPAPRPTPAPCRRRSSETQFPAFVAAFGGEVYPADGVDAFIDDPVERWLWPEAQQYLTFA
jgi:Troponin I residues 1-32